MRKLILLTSVILSLLTATKNSYAEQICVLWVCFDENDAIYDEEDNTKIIAYKKDTFEETNDYDEKTSWTYFPDSKKFDYLIYHNDDLYMDSKNIVTSDLNHFEYYFDNYFREDGSKSDTSEWGKIYSEDGKGYKQVSNDWYYYADGNPENEDINETTYDNDGNELSFQHIYKEYFEDGTLAQDQYEEESPETGRKYYEKLYDETGKLLQEQIEYDNPDGTNGYKNIDYTSLDENGNPIIYMEYCDTYVCGEAYYDTKGNILKINDNNVAPHCSAANIDGTCTKCNGESFKLNDGECDRIHYTPAEAAEVLTDDNNNSVTITFKM